MLVVWRVAARTAGPWPAVALVAPLAASTYVLSGSAWLTTDMASMALGTAAIAIAACWRPEPRTFLALGALFAAALLVRQTNVYLAVPVVAAGILGSPLGRSVSNAEQWHGEERQERHRHDGRHATAPGARGARPEHREHHGPECRAQHDGRRTPAHRRHQRGEAPERPAPSARVAVGRALRHRGHHGDQHGDGRDRASVRAEGLPDGRGHRKEEERAPQPDERQSVRRRHRAEPRVVQVAEGGRRQAAPRRHQERQRHDARHQRRRRHHQA
ncbi:MAG: glycosyltransferase family 39 protein [Phycisphaerales bacterium]